MAVHESPVSTNPCFSDAILAPIRLLTMVAEYTRECLAIDLARHLISEDVLERLSGFLSVVAFPNMCVQTTARSLRRKPFGTGWHGWRSRRCTSNQVFAYSNFENLLSFKNQHKKCAIGGQNKTVRVSIYVRHSAKLVHR